MKKKKIIISNSNKNINDENVYFQRKMKKKNFALQGI